MVWNNPNRDEALNAVAYAKYADGLRKILTNAHSQCMALTKINQLNDPKDITLTERLEKLETCYQEFEETYETADSIMGPDENTAQKREAFIQSCDKLKIAISDAQEEYQLRLDLYAICRSIGFGLNNKLEDANKGFARVLVTNMIDNYRSDPNSPEEPNADYIIKSMLSKDGDFKPLGEAIAHYGQVSQEASEEILNLLELIEPIIKDQEVPILNITIPVYLAMKNQQMSMDNPQTQMVCLKTAMERFYYRLNPKT